MPRGSNLPPPHQWNLHGWLAAYYESQGYSPNAQNTKKEEEMEPMTGGWQYEGKEPPPPIRICPKCQGPPFRKDLIEEVDTSAWCEACQEGKSPIGSKPKYVKKTQHH